jgi:hypothetical protein
MRETASREPGRVEMCLRLRGSSEKREGTMRGDKTAIGTMPREEATSSQDTSPKLIRLRQATKHSGKTPRGRRSRRKTRRVKRIHLNEGDNAQQQSRVKRPQQNKGPLKQRRVTKLCRQKCWIKRQHLHMCSMGQRLETEPSRVKKPPVMNETTPNGKAASGEDCPHRQGRKTEALSGQHTKN